MQRVMRGSESIDAHSHRRDVILWTQEAVSRLEELSGALSHRILSACACRYPTSDLQDVRAKYAETKSIPVAHQMLRSKFESFLRDTLSLDEATVHDVIQRGWGLAGILMSDRIVATKIPKSQYLKDYLQESDPETRRRYYCHCPRIRQALELSMSISSTYCYCGSGFYRGIWEDILQVSIDVEVLETVLQGDDVCKFVVYLPR